ncbi:hypothetical protein C8F01DRAFT_1188306 [Mycena amicta]|nr:hypothetical protein C8F01DRAFT_1188306 [Mycena amicta]
MTTTGSLSSHINLLLLHTALRLADCHVGLKELFRRVFPIPIPAHVIVDVGRSASEFPSCFMEPGSLWLLRCLQRRRRGVVKCIGCDVAAAGLASGRVSGKSGSECVLTAVEGVCRYRTVCTWKKDNERVGIALNTQLLDAPIQSALSIDSLHPPSQLCIRPFAHCLAPVKACSRSATDIARHSCRLHELAGC